MYPYGTDPEISGLAWLAGCLQPAWVVEGGEGGSVQVAAGPQAGCRSASGCGAINGSVTEMGVMAEAVGDDQQ